MVRPKAADGFRGAYPRLSERRRLRGGAHSVQFRADHAGGVAQIILHMLHARDRIDAVFGAALGAAIDDGARQRDFAAFDRDVDLGGIEPDVRSEEHTSELQSLMRISYAVFRLKKKQN